MAADGGRAARPRGQCCGLWASAPTTEVNARTKTAANSTKTNARWRGANGEATLMRWLGWSPSASKTTWR
eukprot:8657283-Pyramimonas_sp.AAC.1